MGGYPHNSRGTPVAPKSKETPYERGKVAVVAVVPASDVNNSEVRFTRSLVYAGVQSFQLRGIISQFGRARYSDGRPQQSKIWRFRERITPTRLLQQPLSPSVLIVGPHPSCTTVLCRSLSP